MSDSIYKFVKTYNIYYIIVLMLSLLFVYVVYSGQLTQMNIMEGLTKEQKKEKRS